MPPAAHRRLAVGDDDQGHGGQHRESRERAEDAVADHESAPGPPAGALLAPRHVRGDNARNMDDATGFGLGLSIAKAIVTAHGGELSLHDRKPNGLIVRVQLPPRQPMLRKAA